MIRLDFSEFQIFGYFDHFKVNVFLDDNQIKKAQFALNMYAYIVVSRPGATDGHQVTKGI